MILVLYGLLLGASLCAVLWIVFDGQHQDARDRAAVVTRVEKDLADAKAAQAKKDAKANNEVRLAVCGFLREVNQSTNVKKLEAKFRCDLPVYPPESPAPSPSPQPTATVYIYRPMPSPQARPSSSTPRPPSASKSPTPKPSPSPTCLLPKPLPCPPNRAR